MTVTKLSAAPPAVAHIQEDLRNLLERAERGELRDIVVVASVVDEDGPGYLCRTSFDDLWRLLGALAYAQAQVLK